MPRIPFIRLSAMLPVITYLHRNGCEVDRYFSAGEINPISMSPEDWASRYLPSAKAFELAGILAQREGVDHLGFKAGEGVTADEVPYLEICLSGSLNGFDLLDRFSKFLDDLHYGTETSINLSENGKAIRFCHRQPMPPGASLDGYALLVIINAIRVVAGPNWRPREVWCPSVPKTAASNHEALSEAVIHTNEPYAGLEIPVSVLAKPVDFQLAQKENPNCSAAPGRNQLPNSLVAEVEAYIRTSFGSHPPSIIDAAEIASCSVRTLQSGLGSEGSSFRQLLKKTRYSMARRLLSEGGYSTAEIGHHLGYDDPAHFTRAFKSWSGVPPSRWEGK